MKKLLEFTKRKYDSHDEPSEKKNFCLSLFLSLFGALLPMSAFAPEGWFYCGSFIWTQAGQELETEASGFQDIPLEEQLGSLDEAG